MENINKYNYYITLINMCNSLDDADILITEIADDEIISHSDYCKLYNLLMGKYQRLIANYNNIEFTMICDL